MKLVLLLLFVQLSLLVQLASKGKKGLLVMRLLLVRLLFVQLSLLVQLPPKESGCSCSCSSFQRETSSAREADPRAAYLVARATTSLEAAVHAAAALRAAAARGARFKGETAGAREACCCSWSS
jgi:hypothetical protein